MAIAVPPWTHRVMIREHGPSNSTMKLCLYTVNAFMDDSGEAWPSQSSIARAAGLNEKTVQRLLAQAIDAGWLSVTLDQVKGKAWKRFTYRAAIPDDLEHSEKMQEGKIEALQTYHLDQYGPLPERGRPTKPKTRRVQFPNLRTRKVPVLNPKVPALDAEGPRSECQMVPALNPKVPAQDGTKFPSEVPILSSHMKFPYEGAVASDSTYVEITKGNDLKNRGQNGKKPGAEKIAATARAETENQSAKIAMQNIRKKIELAGVKTLAGKH